MRHQTMPLHEFDDAQQRVPSHLAPRTQRMRACATRAAGCPCCGVARHLLRLAFGAGNTPLAEALVTEAEHYVDHAPHAPNCPQEPPPRGRPAGAPIEGIAAGWTHLPGPLVAATDASWKHGVTGIGYVLTDGRWGMRGRRPVPQDPTGPSAVLVGELRAVALLLDRAEPRTLLVDSLSALRILHAWQRGDRSVMPDGYDLRPRRHSRTPTLARLAARVATRPGLRIEHVKAHSGHPLNETADSLASIARRHTTAPFDSATRAEGLVNAFLHTWHDQVLAA